MINKFVGAVEMVDADKDILVDDLKEGRINLDWIISEAYKHEGIMYVVHEEESKATMTAGYLNEQLKSDDNSKGEDSPMVGKTAFDYGAKEVQVVSGEDTAKAAIEKAMKETKTTKGDGNMTNKTMTGADFLNRNKNNGVKEEVASQSGQESKSVPTKNNQNKGDVQMNNNNTAKGLKGNFRSSGSNTAIPTQGSGNAGKTIPTRSLAGNKQSGLGVNDAWDVKEGMWDDAPVAGRKRFEGPWFLNAGLYPSVNFLNKIFTEKAAPEYGIESIKLARPESRIYHENHKFISVVVIVVDGEEYEFRIKKDEREDKAADVSSSNIDWKFAHGQIAPVHITYKKQDNLEDKMFRGFCAEKECNGMLQVKIGKSEECRCGKVYTAREEEGSVRIYAFDPETLQVNQVDGSKFQVRDYVPVVTRKISREMIAISMAFAQYAHNRPMFGVLDAEEKTEDQ